MQKNFEKDPMLLQRCVEKVVLLGAEVLVAMPSSLQVFLSRGEVAETMCRTRQTFTDVLRAQPISDSAFMNRADATSDASMRIVRLEIVVRTHLPAVFQLNVGPDSDSSGCNPVTRAVSYAEVL